MISKIKYFQAAFEVFVGQLQLKIACDNIFPPRIISLSSIKFLMKQLNIEPKVIASKKIDASFRFKETRPSTEGDKYKAITNIDRNEQKHSNRLSCILR